MFTVKRNGETKTFTAHKGSRDSGAATGAGEGAGAGQADFTVADGSYSFSSAPVKHAASERHSYGSTTTTATASRRHY